MRSKRIQETFEFGTSEAVDVDLSFEMAGEDVCKGFDGDLTGKEGYDCPEM